VGALKRFGPVSAGLFRARVGRIEGMTDERFICTSSVQKKHLIRRTTLTKLFAPAFKSIDWRRKGKERRKLVRDEMQVLQSMAQAGDEWWLWTDRLDVPEGMQCGGIALVRDGEVVWAKQTWLS
jgi:hypothetical protein